MSLIEKRYAEALIGVAVRKKEVETYRQDLLAVTKTLEESNDLSLLLLNPCIGSEIKKEIAGKIFSKNVSPEIFNLTMLLLDGRRIKHLPGIHREYVKLAEKEINELNLCIISSADIGSELLDKIQEKFRKKYKAASVRGEFIIDAHLLGGVKVLVGDKLTDGTVKGRLDSLRESLLKG